MRLTDFGRRFMAFVMAFVMVAGILVSTNATNAYAAGSEETPAVSVLGATLKLDSANESGSQAMRIGIQIEHANRATACAIELKVGSKRYTVTTEAIDESEGRQQKNLHSKDLENKSVIYAVILSGIPKNAFYTPIEITGSATGFDGVVYKSATESRSVMGIVESLQSRYYNLGIYIDDSGSIRKGDGTALTPEDLAGYNPNDPVVEIPDDPAPDYSGYDFTLEDSFAVGGKYLLLFNNAPGSESNISKFYTNTGTLYALADTNSAYAYREFSSEISGDRSGINADYSGLTRYVWLCESYNNIDGQYTFKNMSTGQYLKYNSSGPQYSDTISSDNAFALNSYPGGEGYPFKGISPVSDSTRFFRISNGAHAFAVGSTGTNTNGRNGNVYIYKYNPNKGVVETPVPEQPLTSVLTFSDYQKWLSGYTGDDWSALQPQLTSILTAAKNAGVSPDYWLFGGDFTCTHNVAPELEGMSQVKNIVYNTWSNLNDSNSVLLQGNHDESQPGTDGLASTGAYEFDDFIIYCISEDDYPTTQSSSSVKTTVQNTADALESYLLACKERNEYRPIFIASHGGLHYDIDRTDGNNQFAYVLFEAIEEYADDLDIVFFFAHNHTNGDELVGGSITYFAPGQTIDVCHEDSISNRKGTTETINFTYMNYGYVGYIGDIYNNASNSPFGTDELTNLLVCSDLKIYDDRITVERYSANGHEGAFDRTITRLHNNPQPGQATPTPSPSPTPDPTSWNNNYETQAKYELWTPSGTTDRGLLGKEVIFIARTDDGKVYAMSENGDAITKTDISSMYFGDTLYIPTNYNLYNISWSTMWNKAEGDPDMLNGYLFQNMEDERYLGVWGVELSAQGLPTGMTQGNIDYKKRFTWKATLYPNYKTTNFMHFDGTNFDADSTTGSNVLVYVKSYTGDHAVKNTWHQVDHFTTGREYLLVTSNTPGTVKAFNMTGTANNSYNGKNVTVNTDGTITYGGAYNDSAVINAHSLSDGTFFLNTWNCPGDRHTLSYNGSGSDQSMYITSDNALSTYAFRFKYTAGALKVYFGSSGLGTEMPVRWRTTSSGGLGIGNGSSNTNEFYIFERDITPQDVIPTPSPIPPHTPAPAAKIMIAGSDFQNPNGTAAGQEEVRMMVNSIKNAGFTWADGFMCCGDYDYDLTNGVSQTKEGVDGISEVIQQAYGTDPDMVLIQGNHDSGIGTAGMAPSGNNDTDYCGIFVINEDNYMWYNNNESTIKATAYSLRNYLNEKRRDNYTKPIFVLSHLPLHYSMRTYNEGDAKYAKYLVDVLNEAGEAGLNIIFMYGHNHSNGWDDYLGGSAVFLRSGDEILVSDGTITNYTSEEIHFSYMNAGFTGYYENRNSGVDATLTMSVFEIRDDRVYVSRYDKNGVHNLKSCGVSNEYKNETTIGGYSPNTTVVTSPTEIILNSDIIEPEPTPVPPSWNNNYETQAHYELWTPTEAGDRGMLGKEVIFVSRTEDGKVYAMSENGDAITTTEITDMYFGDTLYIPTNYNLNNIAWTTMWNKASGDPDMLNGYLFQNLEDEKYLGIWGVELSAQGLPSGMTQGNIDYKKRFTWKATLYPNYKTSNFMHFDGASFDADSTTESNVLCYVKSYTGDHAVKNTWHQVDHFTTGREYLIVTSNTPGTVKAFNMTGTASGSYGGKDVTVNADGTITYSGAYNDSAVVNAHSLSDGTFILNTWYCPGDRQTLSYNGDASSDRSLYITSDNMLSTYAFRFKYASGALKAYYGSSGLDTEMPVKWRTGSDGGLRIGSASNCVNELYIFERDITPQDYTVSGRAYSRITDPSQIKDGDKILMIFDGQATGVNFGPEFMIPEVVSITTSSTRTGFNVVSTDVATGTYIYGDDYEDYEWTFTRSGSGWIISTAAGKVKFTEVSGKGITATLETTGDVLTMSGTGLYTFYSGEFCFNRNTSRTLINAYRGEPAHFYLYRYDG